MKNRFKVLSNEVQGCLYLNKTEREYLLKYRIISDDDIDVDGDVIVETDLEFHDIESELTHYRKNLI